MIKRMSRSPVLVAPNERRPNSNTSRMAKLSALAACATRNGGNANKLDPADNYRAWLCSKGGTGRTIRDLEKSFFAANGGSGKYYSELMGTFCAAKGFSGGRSVQENWRRFLNSGVA